MKKLVPARRSSNKRMPAPSRTGKESNASTAVVNQAQHVNGMRIRDIPRVRMLSKVVMKFSAPSSEPTQKIAMLMIQRFRPLPCPGPALGKALSGGYPVQPPIGPIVDSEPVKNIADRITINPIKVTQNDSM